MLKKLLLALIALMATMNFAFADVDVNKADQAALDGVKGIGPVKAKAIIEERTKNGSFKDWADFQTRVKGIGDKNSVKLSEAGLTVNGQAKSGAPAAKPAADAKPAKVAKADKAAKADPMPDAAPAKAEKTADKATEKADKASKKAMKADAAAASASKAAVSAKDGKTK